MTLAGVAGRKRAVDGGRGRRGLGGCAGAAHWLRSQPIGAAAAAQQQPAFRRLAAFQGVSAFGAHGLSEG